VSLLDSLFSHAVNGVQVIFFQLTLPGGADLLIFGVILTLIMLFRPSGITGGRELTLSFGRLGRPRRDPGGEEA
jgi:ABC-type branched-subunit amino acid transport system permease subunit